MKKIGILFWVVCIFSLHCFCQKDSISFGIATFYSDWFEGKMTSNGEIFNQSSFTAAHKNIPLGTFLKVTNRSTNHAIIVKVNDRCPKQGVLDLSKSAAKKLGILHKGTTKIKIEILGKDGVLLWEAQKFLFTNYFDFFEERKEKLIDSLLNSPSFLKKNAIQAQSFFTYSIELGYVKNLTAAKNVMSLLSIKYIPFVKGKVSGKNGYILTLGPFFNLQELKQTKNEIAPFFPDAIAKENEQLIRCK